MSFPFELSGVNRVQVRLPKLSSWRPEAQNPACIERGERKYQQALLAVSQGRTPLLAPGFSRRRLSA